MIIGQVRGFFKHLMNDMNDGISFVSEGDTYEVASSLKNIIAKILRTRVVGFFGIFRVLNKNDSYDEVDYLLSFNRFARVKKPYIIYLENPTALVNYSLSCLGSPFVTKKINNLIMDDNLKQIVCMSKACESTLTKVLGVDIPKEKITQIYPYVPDNYAVNEEIICSRSKADELKLLYIAQGSRFKSKGGLEIIEAYTKVRRIVPISLTIITNLEMLDEATNKSIREEGIQLLEFNLNYNELEKIYAEHHVLLQPSSDDSFGLTVLEAMKAGLAIIASDLYAFKEMVENGGNGIVVKPAYRFFDENNIPNPSVWNNREKTIYSGNVNMNLVEELFDAITTLARNRELLSSMSVNSYRKANSEYGKDRLFQQWHDIMNNIK